MLMERCVQTDVLDIVTGSEKGSRDLLILPCAKEQTLPNVLGGGGSLKHVLTALLQKYMSFPNTS